MRCRRATSYSSLYAIGRLLGGSDPLHEIDIVSRIAGVLVGDQLGDADLDQTAQLAGRARLLDDGAGLGGQRERRLHRADPVLAETGGPPGIHDE
ncbi:MAG: hypothetical protein AUI36_13335 [Cyanobacteria bacterium 13_1_40CM_2_61_4]|nr:MAG: hypothetical protein AUI36_13335 [Cyanobacteria bacterium 13_1_40CM_2_61_4]